MSRKKVFLALAWHTLAYGSQITQIHLGEACLDVEIANTEASRRQGLMFRKELPDGKGMLFIHDGSQTLSYWMKNTSIPLSIAFFDENSILLNIEEMPPYKDDASLQSFKSIAPARYALEVPQGWFERHNIRPGMKFSFREPSKLVQ